MPEARLLIRWVWLGVVALLLIGGCTKKRTTSPVQPNSYLMEQYFPLGQGDRWIWEVGGDWIQEYFVDEGDQNLGEPFLDINRNGLHDFEEPYEDLNFNGDYDGPDDPWTPGVPYVDRNSNGEYDTPNGIWDEGENFVDLDGDGICGTATILTLDAHILSPQDSVTIRRSGYQCTFYDGMPGGMWAGSDGFSNDALGVRWHNHTDRTDWRDFLGDLTPITIAKASVQVRDSVVSIDTSYVQGDPSGTHTWVSVFEKVEDVIVPAGTFRDCLKFRSVASGWMWNMQTFDGTSYQWYAEDVGLVKSEGPGQGEYWILKSATVGSRTYP